MLSKLTVIFFLGLLSACNAADDAQAGLQRGAFAEIARTTAQAEAGDVAAQTALGTHYYLGVSAPRDYRQAFQWYGRAALAGDPHAQRNLGSLFRQGLGTPRDDFRAFGWYAESYTNGNPDALFYMKWTALVVGMNQQALARRIIAKDLKAQHITEGVAKEKGR